MPGGNQKLVPVPAGSEQGSGSLGDRPDLWRIMAIPRDSLEAGSGVRVRVLDDTETLALSMAEEMAQAIRASQVEDRPKCFIVPVGPVGQYAQLARIILEERLDCSRITFINMDEFLDEHGCWIASEHPFSFRGFMDRAFYDRLPPRAGFRVENRIFPEPGQPERIAQVIADRGDVDVVFGGIGLNGHLAFNEPEETTVEEFAERTTRVVTVAPETRAHVAVNLSCALGLVPYAAVTVGMREILAARRLCLYANRPWQRGVVRMALHGPVGPGFPASYLQRHHAGELTMTAYVAEAPEVRLQ